MAGKKSVYWAEDLGQEQFRLRMHYNDPYDERQWFFFDARTQTIRAWAKKNYVIANQIGQGFNINVAVAIRPYTEINQDKIRWYSGQFQNIRNNGDKCLDVYGNQDTDDNHVIYWNCHNGLNQAWRIDQKEKRWPKQPLEDGVKFQLRSRMDGGRALYYAEEITPGQHRLRIRDSMPFDSKQWWVFD